MSLENLYLPLPSPRFVVLDRAISPRLPVPRSTAVFMWQMRIMWEPVWDYLPYEYQRYTYPPKAKFPQYAVTLGWALRALGKVQKFKTLMTTFHVLLVPPLSPSISTPSAPIPFTFIVSTFMKI